MRRRHTGIQPRSVHPDLASTLNNLAFICERTNKLDEAEHGYRRAHAIAVASLGPRHPFVTTSLKNLVDFCAAHEIPFWKPPAAVLDDEASSPESEAETPPEPVLPVYKPGRRWPPRRIAEATIGVAAVVAVAFAVQRRGITDTFFPSRRLKNRPSSTNDSPATSVTTPTQTGKHQPTVTLERRAGTTPAPVERPNAPETSITSASVSVSVLNAQLCSAPKREGHPTRSACQ